MAEEDALLVERLESFVKEHKQHWIDFRRELHQYPEWGWMEYVTTYKIGSTLQALGFDVWVGQEALDSKERMGVPAQDELAHYEASLQDQIPSSWLQKMEGGHTGLVARWDTGKEGPHMAFRFDIDALPIEEAQREDHAPFAEGFCSAEEGKMHACAHDGHATLGIGVAQWVARCQEELGGTYTLLFQPAEEGSRGAKAMVAQGWLDGVDYFLSGHIGLRSMQVGDVVATTSGFLATTKMDVAFKGRSAHAGMEPQAGNNALLAASSAVLHLASIAPHADGVTRLNVGTLTGGTGRNIVADEAYMELETRGGTTALNQYMVQEAKRILEASGRLYDVDVQVDVVGEGIGAESDQDFVLWTEEACASSTHVQQVIPHLAVGGSEDVTYMMKHVQEQGGKATYYVFGTPLASGHHHPLFDYDEGVLPVGIETYVRMIHYLQKRA